MFDTIRAPENILRAFYTARRGKRYRPEADRFHVRLEENMLELAEALADGSYRPGPYHHFLVHEPKERLVSAAPFRDRVVHHAICRVIEPIFETKFIHDTYACRRGKGQHRALDRFTHFARRYDWCLKLDIAKYFASIDHGRLLELLSRTLRDDRLMEVIARIVASGAGIHPASSRPEWFRGDHLFTPLERPRGLPIGNLTSQLFANIYLSPLDDFIKRSLGCRAYLRFTDDLALFAPARPCLLDWRDRIDGFLDHWRLRTHPEKCRVGLVSRGVPFLGFLVYPDHRRVLGAGRLLRGGGWNNNNDNLRAAYRNNNNLDNRNNNVGFRVSR